jgi:phosphonate transport system permease protein
MSPIAQSAEPALVRPPSPWPGLIGRGAVALAGCVALWAMMADLKLEPEALFAGLSKLGRFLSAMVPPSDGGDSLRILRSLAETFAMAVAGTVLAVVAAVPLGLLGAKTIVHNSVAHFLFRRCLDIFRGVPALVWALIFISAFGLGPFAGVIALAFADIPNLAKLFAESLENCDPGPSEGARAAGVSKLMEIRFGLAPQVAPVMASQCLYFLESNFRHAAVLGIVGAGGIGFELDERIRVFAFDQVAFIVLLYMLGVAVLDFGSRSLRARLA